MAAANTVEHAEAGAARSAEEGASVLMGQMMSAPLLISSLIIHADRYHGSAEIVSRRMEGDLHRYIWRDCHRRARQLANLLGAIGIVQGDRVATLAWNGYRQ